MMTWTPFLVYQSRPPGHLRLMLRPTRLQTVKTKDPISRFPQICVGISDGEEMRTVAVSIQSTKSKTDFNLMLVKDFVWSVIL
jgi:hypothetical protein